MAAPPANHPGSLQYQTLILRVPIHCEGCTKKVKKILRKIDGVYMTTVDAQQHKVTVTGNIDSETLLKKLSKSGKPAQLWPEKSKKTDKLEELPEMKNNDIATTKGGEDQKTKKGDEKSSADKHDIPENIAVAPVLDGGILPELPKGDQVEGNKSEGNGGKKKKKKSKGQGQDGDSTIGNKPPPPVPESIEALPPENMPAAGTHEQAPPPAQVPAMPPMKQTKPMQTINTGAPTNVGPPHHLRLPNEQGNGPAINVGPQNHQGLPNEPGNEPANNFGPPINLGLQNHRDLPYEPCRGPENNFGHVNQPGYLCPQPNQPPPQMGVSYSMAQPSANTSYYTPPYYAYAFPQHPMMHGVPPPPPSHSISDAYDGDHYNDDASSCRLM